MMAPHWMSTPFPSMNVLSFITPPPLQPPRADFWWFLNFRHHDADVSQFSARQPMKLEEMSQT